MFKYTPVEIDHDSDLVLGNCDWMREIPQGAHWHSDDDNEAAEQHPAQQQLNIAPAVYQGDAANEHPVLDIIPYEELVDAAGHVHPSQQLQLNPAHAVYQGDQPVATNEERLTAEDLQDLIPSFRNPECRSRQVYRWEKSGRWYLVVVSPVGVRKAALLLSAVETTVEGHYQPYLEIRNDDPDNKGNYQLSCENPSCQQTRLNGAGRRKATPRTNGRVFCNDTGLPVLCMTCYYERLQAVGLPS